MKPLLFVVVLLLFAESVLALEVQVKGLFGGAAVLSINGREQLLKTGQRSSEGVQLVSADSEKAVILYSGEQKTLYLSEHIAASFSESNKQVVQISIDEDLRYLTHGSINGRPVKFLIDTGANVVAMNASTAKALGISLAGGVQSRAATASGVVSVTAVTLNEVRVGGITRENVEAVVMNGRQPTEILLGMSFLRNVNINEKAGLMTLTSQF